MKKLRILVTFRVFLLLLCNLTIVNAATVYSDRVTFDGRLASSITDGYDNLGYSPGDLDPLPAPNFDPAKQSLHSDSSMSSILGETQYQATGHLDHNWILRKDTDAYYCAGCNGSFLLSFNSTSVGDSTGVFGVGFDFFNVLDSDLGGGLGGGYHAFIVYGDGSTEDYILPIASTAIADPFQFWGVTSTLSISSIHFGRGIGSSTILGNFGIDDLTIGSSIVPLPAAVWLFGSGLLGLIGVSRRKKST